MRWLMRAKFGLAALVVAAWWVTVNVAWVRIGDKTLTGGELANWLNLFPGVALAAIFIASYGKGQRILALLASLFLIYAGVVSITWDWVVNPAVTNALEQLSGVMNADQHMAGVAVTVTTWPLISGLIALISAGITLWAGFLSTKSRVAKTEANSDSKPDNRSLWDEQS